MQTILFTIKMALFITVVFRSMSNIFGFGPWYRQGVTLLILGAGLALLAADYLVY